METALKNVRAGNSALIVIDVQNDYLHPDGKMALAGRDVRGVDSIVDNISAFIDHARTAGIPVVLVRMVHSGWTDSPIWVERKPNPKETAICRPGTFGHEFYRIRPRPEDLIIEKSRYSAFVGTGLDLAMRSKGIETLVFCGFATNVCLGSTVIDACNLGYRNIIIGELTGGYFKDEADAALKNLGKYFGRVVSAGEVLQAWRANG